MDTYGPCANEYNEWSSSRGMGKTMGAWLREMFVLHETIRKQAMDNVDQLDSQNECQHV